MTTNDKGLECWIAARQYDANASELLHTAGNHSAQITELSEKARSLRIKAESLGYIHKGE